MPEVKRIPDKGVDFVMKWAAKVHPIIERDGKPYHFENTTNHFRETFQWSAKPERRARGLTEVGRITTYHTYGYYGFFKPSVAEVIQQIPEDILGEADYFLVKGPRDADDLNEHRDIVNEGYHVAETILYRKD